MAGKWQGAGVLLAALLAFGAATGATAEGIDPLLRQRLEQLSERGNAEAWYHLGMLANAGIGGARDLPLAYQRFQRAEALGDALAAYKIGCYLAGQFPGVVTVDPAAAMQYKLVAARAGYSLAQVDVANMLMRDGKVVEARPWLQSAADQGEAQALYNLSVGHLKSLWGEPDRVAAYANFKLAKLVSEGRINPQAELTLQDIARQLSAEDKARADAMVSDWKARPSELTLRAKAGLRAAQTLTAGQMS